MPPLWIENAIVYHIYPLGLCGAPARNDFQSAPVARLEQLYGWLDHIQSLGANTLYLGPLFESTAHGYDTADYFQVDRRLGTRETLASFSKEVHRRGMRLILDGVFNHTGRNFWAFRDILANRERSPYTSWFQNLDFNGRSPAGDPFHYEGWADNYDLVKLNLGNPQVRQYLFDAVRDWVDTYEIDGLRLDAADAIDPAFLDALAGHCRSLRSDFWLMGEMVFGDYRQLAAPNRLDSTTNYEAYKALYSSLVDKNYFEIAYALKRQSGPGGIYRDLALYNFVDNHDVNRVASQLKTPAHLYPLYLLLFTMPGVPSIYYGSEWGIAGQRTPWNDAALRPRLDLGQAHNFSQPDLPAAIARLSRLRQESPALRKGGYEEVKVASEQLAFLRSDPTEQVLVILNSSGEPAPIDLRLPFAHGWLVDCLNPGDRFQVQNHSVHFNSIPSNWGRILRIEP